MTTTQFQNQKPHRMIRQYLRNRIEIVSATLAVTAYPLWWLCAKEFCVSQPPIFLIFICAGYGLLAITRPIKFVRIAGLFELCLAFTFTVESMFGVASKARMPVLIILISSGLCIIVFLIKALLFRQTT